MSLYWERATQDVMGEVRRHLTAWGGTGGALVSQERRPVIYIRNQHSGAEKTPHSKMASVTVFPTVEDSPTGDGQKSASCT